VVAHAAAIARGYLDVNPLSLGRWLGLVRFEEGAYEAAIA
jgi:hypothetical protein